MVTNVSAQSDQNETSNKFTGTWFGSAIQNFDGAGSKKVINLIWRIHSIDNVHKEIRLTEINPFHVDSAIAGEKPTSVICSGYNDDGNLILELVNRPTTNKIVLKLKVEYDDGSILLKGIVERSQDIKDCYAFMFVKIDSDTSTYVKPKNDNGLKIDIIKQPYNIERKPSLNR